MVIGCGGVGLNSIQAASIVGAASVIAMDLSADKRKLVDRISRLAENLPRQRPREGGGLKNQSQTTYAGTTRAPRQEYLQAARRAIDHLGENAERSDLLNCAAKFLESAR